MKEEKVSEPFSTPLTRVEDDGNRGWKKDESEKIASSFGTLHETLWANKGYQTGANACFVT